MERARMQRGFTIIEVLVVLAVTGAMFIMAVYAINGKQNETEFQQSVNDIRSSIQQVIDQTAAGDYANTGNFTCDGTLGNLVIQSGANKQGSNTGCLFLGKVLQFAVHGTSPQQYKQYSIVGLQNNTGTLASAMPTALAPGVTTNNGGNFPDASVTEELHNGLNVVSMTSNGNNIGAVAFMSSLGQYSGGQLLSGSQTMNLIPVSNSALNATPGAMVDAINQH
jgi:prepilin-type N-terminal cleavage/methylation domain-containing protein